MLLKFAGIETEGTVDTYINPLQVVSIKPVSHRRSTVDEFAIEHIANGTLITLSDGSTIKTTDSVDSVVRVWEESFPANNQQKV